MDDKLCSLCILYSEFFFSIFLDDNKFITKLFQNKFLFIQNRGEDFIILIVSRFVKVVMKIKELWVPCQTFFGIS